MKAKKNGQILTDLADKLSDGDYDTYLHKIKY